MSSDFYEVFLQNGFGSTQFCKALNNILAGVNYFYIQKLHVCMSYKTARIILSYPLLNLLLKDNGMFFFFEYLVVPGPGSLPQDL